MAQEEKGRVLLCKHWMDGHDRGVKYVAKKLRDWGFEVIYILYRVPEDIVSTAIAEDVDAIGISFSTGAHMTHTIELRKLLQGKSMEHIPLIIGGMIPTRDERELLKMGIAGVFSPGSDIETLKNIIYDRVAKEGKP